MSNPTVISEGCVKYRDGRKWKSRWAVISKLSPVADCLHLQVYRDSKDRYKNNTTKSSLSLDGFLAIESGFTLDKESNTIAIICKDLVVVIAFDTRETLIQWLVKIKTQLCDVHQYLVQMTSVPTKSKLSVGPARLHIQNYTFCLVSSVPPRLLAYWPIKELRRFGIIDGKFCFEGGSHCGKGEGLHVVHTNQCQELAKCFELALNGKLHDKTRVSSNRTIDGSVRMSLPQTKCHHKICDCGGSNESSHHLISCNSETSVCDACSEVMRFNSTNTLNSNFDNDISGDSDDQYSSNSTCSTILRCSSGLSYNGVHPYISSASVTTDNDFYITSSSSQIYNGCSDNGCSLKSISNTDCNTLPKCSQFNDKTRSTWASSQCIQCGHHYRSDIYDSAADDIHVSHITIPNNTLSAINLSEFQSISPSFMIRDYSQHNNHSISSSNNNNNNNTRNICNFPDRASLCSQSSQSSGASNSSNSSGSGSSGGHTCNCNQEYSVPRLQSTGKTDLLVDMLYDKPKHIQHKMCNIMTKREQMSLCSCHLNLLDQTVDTNKNTVILNTDSKTINYSQLNNSSHLSDVSSKDLNGIKCHQIIEDYGEQHYSIPRTALANIYLKELKQSQQCLTKNMDNIIGETYDIPRKFQESMNGSMSESIIDNVCHSFISTAKHKRQSNSCNCEKILNDNNNTILANNSYHTSAINHCTYNLQHNLCSQNQINTSPMNPLTVQTMSTISRQNDCKSDIHLPFNNCNHCKTVGNSLGETLENKCDECMERVNQISDRNKFCLKEDKQQQPTSLHKKDNYINIHFIQSLPLYENIKCIQFKDHIIDGNIKHKLKDRLLPESTVHIKQEVQDNSGYGNYEMMEKLMTNHKDLLLEKSINNNNNNNNENKVCDDYMFMSPTIMTDKTISDELTVSSYKSIQNNTNNNPTIQRFLRAINSNKNKKLLNTSHDIKSGAINGFINILPLSERSNSFERKDLKSKICISVAKTTLSSSCPSSPDLKSKGGLRSQKLFVDSKISTNKSIEKSFSIDDLSIAKLSHIQTHYYRHLGHKLLSYKSADCLKQKQDYYHSSDEDICTGSQITVLCASPVRNSCFIESNKSLDEILTEKCDPLNNSSQIILQF